MAFRVVLDTCVLVPMPLRDTLLTFAALDLFVPKWSERSLDSMERVLVEDLAVERAAASRVRQVIHRVFEDATVSTDRTAALESSMTNPVHDRHVLAAAVAINAAKIVTLNIKDFPVDACEPHAVEALTPDEFLVDLLEVDSRRVMMGLEQQAARLRHPPMSVTDILERLERDAPKFSAAVRTLIEQRLAAG